MQQVAFRMYLLIKKVRLQGYHFPSPSDCILICFSCVYVFLHLDNIMDCLEENDNNIMEYLEEINQTLHQRLGSLEDSNNLRQNYKTGDFLNPAHNCSHILHYHPQATSGKIVVILRSF